METSQKVESGEPMPKIYFSSPKDPDYGFLATNYDCPIAIDNIVFPTIAHFMLCAQCPNPLIREEIRTITDYSKAKQYFISKRITRKPLLELKALLEGIMQKFIQHPDLAQKLVQSGNSYIACGTKDKIYGISLSKEEFMKGLPLKGKNHLGLSLMKARDILIKAKSKNDL